jgi:protein gp37
MPDAMITNFGHHLIPLLPPRGPAGALGSKAWLTAVKETCKSVARIHGALHMAGRKEIAVIPTDPDFFDNDCGLANARNAVWGAIKNATRLHWTILTRYPHQVAKLLPSDWIGKGYKNVCIGLTVETAEGLEDRIAALRSISVPHRMLHLLPSADFTFWKGGLDGIDWVVLSGTAEDSHLAASIRDECGKAGRAFLFHHTDGENPATPDDLASLRHPFGTEIRLDRPPMAELAAMAAKIHARGLAPENSDPVAQAEESSESKVVSPLPVESQIDTLRLDFEVIDDSLDVSEIAPTGMTSAGDVELGGANGGDDFHRLDTIVRASLGYFIVAGRALEEIRERELWRAAGRSSWADYCQTVGGLTKVHANRLIRAAEIAGYLAKVEPIGFTPAAESQMRPLYRLEKPEQCAAAWSLGVERAGGQPTAKLLGDVVAELMADDTPSASKPPRQKRVSDAIKAMREAITASAVPKELIRLLKQIERLVG